MSQTIGSYDAKTHLSRLLDEVEGGRTYIITKHGRPVARLAPTRGAKRRERDVVTELLRFRKGKTLGIPIRDAIDEGRKH